MKPWIEKAIKLGENIAFAILSPFQLLFYVLVCVIMPEDEPRPIHAVKQQTQPIAERKKPAKRAAATAPEPETPQIAESVDALVSLGFSKKSAKARVLAALRIKPDAEVTEIIKIALRG